MRDTTNNQIVPFEYESHKVRSTVIGGDPWFIATDICNTLSLSDASTALRKLDDDEKMKAPRKLYGLEGGSDIWLVNESGLYALIMRSNKPEAKAFRKWVTSVLQLLKETYPEESDYEKLYQTY